MSQMGVVGYYLVLLFALLLDNTVITIMLEIHTLEGVNSVLQVSCRVLGDEGAKLVYILFSFQSGRVSGPTHKFEFLFALNSQPLLTYSLTDSPKHQLMYLGFRRLVVCC